MMLLYYLSQKPDFADNVKPLMSQLKNSEHMLSFLNDLSKFTQTLSAFTGGKCEQEPSPPPPPPKPEEGCKKEQDEDNKNPQSPTLGIADEFIQQILESYLKKH